MKYFLTKKEVCKILGICEMTLNRYMKLKKISYYKDDGGKSARVRFTKDDIEKYINSLKK